MADREIYLEYLSEVMSDKELLEEYDKKNLTDKELIDIIEKKRICVHCGTDKDLTVFRTQVVCSNCLDALLDYAWI